MDTTTQIDTAYQAQLTAAAAANADKSDEVFERLTGTWFPAPPPAKDQLSALAATQNEFASFLREVVAPTPELAAAQERVAAAMAGYGELLGEIAGRHDLDQLTPAQVSILNDGSEQFQEMIAAAEAFMALGYTLDDDTE